jgi:hypothetical protein
MGTASADSNAKHVFRIFISYASEDLAIATAVARCFRTALPEYFAEVNVDKEFLAPGSAFQTQIEQKLQETDIFLLIYTGTEKPSHGYTGWEVGYFDRIMRTDPARRKKICLYLYNPSALTTSEQGVPLGVTREQLQLSPLEFKNNLAVSPADPLCREIAIWQEQVAKNIEAGGFHRQPLKPEQEPAVCVRQLRVAIYDYLRGTVETVVKPQKQITIRVKSSALEAASDTLPPEAELRPVGKGGSMSIFGLADEVMTWKAFLDATAANPFSGSWNHSITSVILSSFPDRVDVDNSQVIVAIDGKTGYRVVLTTATKFYDDDREYNLYFVEMLKRSEFGDQDTTDLLKGLHLVCRFRFMFLEPGSDFLGKNVLLMNINRIPQLGKDLLRELNLLHRDAQDAGLDRPGVWAKYIDYDHLRKISDGFQPCEISIRAIVPRIIAASGQPALLEPLRQELAEVLTAMDTIVRPENGLLLRQMADALNHIVERQDQLSS